MDEQIKKILDNHEERLKKIEGIFLKSEREQIKKEKSMREFLNNYNFKNDLDKVLIILYYLEELRGLDKISIKEIAGGFKEVREPIPYNIADKFQKLTKKGYIMPVKKVEKINAWTYTDSGKKYLESIQK